MKLILLEEENTFGIVKSFLEKNLLSGLLGSFRIGVSLFASVDQPSPWMALSIGGGFSIFKAAVLGWRMLNGVLSPMNGICK